MKKLAKNIPSPYKFEGTPIFRDTTALPFLNGGPLVDKTNHGKLLNSIYASALGDYYRTGGQFPIPYSLPEDSFMQGGNNLHNSVHASSPGQYPAPYNFGGTLHNNLATRQQMYMPLDHITREGGSILSMSNTFQLEGEGKDLVYKNGRNMQLNLLHNTTHKLGGTMNFKSNNGTNMYADGGFANAGFMALPKEVQAKIRANTFADGGPMDAQLTEFSEGGRHEENPLGGIPQGTAPDGKLNLVEQGETKLNSANYIFSDSLKIDKGTAEEFALPKNEVGKTFAEISKKLNRPNSRRENDTIEQVAIKRDLDNLMNAQEAFKQKEVQKKMEEIQALDPNALAGIQQGAPEMPQSVQPMGMPEGQPMDPNQISPEMMAQMPEAQQGQPVMAMGGGMYKCGGKMYNFGGGMTNKFFGGGDLQPSNIDYSQYQNNGLQNPYAQNNGLNGAANNGLNNSTLQDQGFRDFSAGTGAEEQKDPLLSKEQKEGIGGAMGGIGAAIGGTGMANAPTAGKNAQTAQGVKSGIIGAVTAINPIVGGAIALGQGIGTAVRKKTEAVDEEGQLINEGKAERGYVAGHFFDPVGAAIEDWSNPNLNTGQKLLSTIGLSALNRKAYAQGLEKNARANLGITGSGQTPLEGESGYNGTFAQSSGNGFREGGFAHNAGPMGQPLTNLYALGGPTNSDNAPEETPFNLMGGYLDAPTEDDMINHLTNLEQSETTHSFLRGGGFNLERDRLGNIVPYKANYDALSNAASLENPYDKGSMETKMALPVNEVDYSTMTEEEVAQYLSDLQEADETLKDKNQDLTMNQSLAQGVGQLLPAAYNVGQGLFGKVGTLNPKNFYQKADFQPWEYNINPQLKEVQRSYAQLSKAAQNSGLGGGSYMSNMQQGAMSRNEAMSKLYAEKQNVDAANALDAKVRNKAIEASNKGILANVTDYNIKAKEAKRQMLATGLKQGAEAARSSAEMDAQTAYMKLIAPDFASTFKYNTIFDQASEKVKAAAKKKKEQEG